MRRILQSPEGSSLGIVCFVVRKLQLALGQGVHRRSDFSSVSENSVEESLGLG